MANLGVPLIVPRRYYLIAPWIPSFADALLQTFVLDPDSPTNLAYVCLGWAKTMPDDFVERARAYGLSRTARQIIEYARAPGTVTGLPFPEKEHYLELAEQYGGL